MKTNFNSLTADHERISFARFEAVPSQGKPGFYPGVLIIQKGPAKGHFAVEEDGRLINCDWENPAHLEAKKYQIIIGDITLDDVAKCGAEEGNTKAKLDHGSTVKDVVGDYSTFRREGDQVRADLTLMVSSTYREYVEELFAKFARKVGNSIDFDYRYDKQGELAVARCIKLNSVDIVDAPAATNSLFNENTPNQIPRMALTKEEITELRSMFKEEIKVSSDALETKFNAKFEEVKTKMEEGGEDDEEKKKKKDKEDDDKTEMSAGRIEKAVLAAVRQVLPKTTVDNINSLASRKDATGASEEYDEKHAALMTGGMSATHATRFMAAKHKNLFNAKYGGAPAATSAKL